MFIDKLTKSALALAQIGTHLFALQWIFAFIISGLLFIGSIVFSIPQVVGQGREIRQEGRIVSEDRERAPLLEDQ